ncbi:hypothetical protein IC582_006148 [Cucumis melo]
MVATVAVVADSRHCLICLQKLLITCCRHCYRRPAWRRENRVFSFSFFFLVYLIAYLFRTEPKNPN